MADKTLSYTKQQNKERPKIRQVAEKFLNDDLREQLEVFLQYTEENKMSLSLCRANTYESKYKGKIVFRIEIASGQACQNDIYAIKVYTADDPIHFREEKRELIQNNLSSYLTLFESEAADSFINHLSHCRGCGKCSPGVNLEINGKSHSSVCACDIYSLRFTNPSASEYVFVKEFISARRNYIIESKITGERK